MSKDSSCVTFTNTLFGKEVTAQTQNEGMGKNTCPQVGAYHNVP